MYSGHLEGVVLGKDTTERKFRARAVAQWVKCLLDNGKDPSSDLQVPCKNVVSWL